MADTLLSGPPVAPGYPYALEIEVAGAALFLAGCALRADVREYPDAPARLAHLTTANGKLTRVDDNTVLIDLSGDDTDPFPGGGTVWIDLVRSDTNPDIWLGVQLRLPVAEVVTRPEPEE